MMKRLLIVAFSASVLSGCVATTYDVNHVKELPEKVCIVENSKVHIEYVLPVIRNTLGKHGIETVVCQTEDECKTKGTEYRLDYVVYRGWDLGMYLKGAILDLYKDQKLVANASLSVSGWNLAKWANNEAKLADLVEQLLGKAASEQ